VRGGEGEPDRAAAAEELARVGRRLVVAEDPQRGIGREQRARAEREIEADHVAVRDPERLGEVHRSIQSDAR
jgi:hypothetical protein